ncbi:MAG: S8 family peptidase, partial [Planctomycetota bacterium]
MKTKIFATLLTMVLLLGVLSTGGADPGKIKVIITFNTPPTVEDEALIRGNGGWHKATYTLVPAIAATIPKARLEGLQRNPRIARIDLDGKVFEISADLQNTWGVAHIGAGTAHNNGNLGAGVNVAIVDSGVDYTHPDLNDNCLGGYDFVNGDSDPMDDRGHGTHVAGTVAAEANTTGVCGVAPAAKIVPLKVLDANGEGNWSDIISALQWMTDVNNPIQVQVANFSLGSSQDPGDTVEAAFASAEAYGIVLVAAAGNSARPNGKGNTVEYPGRFASVIAVGATDSNDVRASFSSTGDTVELAAPGVGIPSTYLNHGYAYGDGTSMASPHVAGTAALVIATQIADGNANGRINDEVRQRLVDTADDLGNSGRDPWYGFGLVDAAEAGTPTGPVNQVPVV